MRGDEREVGETDLSIPKLIVHFCLGKRVRMSVVMMMGKWSEMVRSEPERGCKVSPVEQTTSRV